MVLWSLDDYQQARQLLNDTFTRSCRVLGEDHTITLSSASILGLALWSLGDYQQARQLQDDAFTRSRRVLGERVSAIPTAELGSVHTAASRAVGRARRAVWAGCRGRWS